MARWTKLLPLLAVAGALAGCVAGPAPIRYGGPHYGGWQNRAYSHYQPAPHWRGGHRGGWGHHHRGWR
ncbi:MAG: hypothetical protein K2X11_05290 [Acetobacteraceae bacterium]|nr:hypothetical protein [Acetobacteraceae bacterium]